MRLYICADGSYAGTQADAKAKGKGWREVDVPTDKAGLLAWLNVNLMPETVLDGGAIEAAPPPPPPIPSYVHQSVQLDEDFDALPLARQLDLAARAMENARSSIKK